MSSALSELAEISKAKSRTTRQDAGRGAAYGAAGYGAAGVLHARRGLNQVESLIGPVPKKVHAAVGTGHVIGRGVRGAVIGGTGGLVVNALRQDKDQKTTTSKAFANRDENSSIPTRTQVKNPDQRFKAASIKAVARTTAGSGTRSAVSAKDQNSSPAVRWMQPRHRETGRFVSHENDLKIAHREGSSGRKVGASHRVDRFTNDGAKVGHGVKKGMDFGQVGKVGRRIA